MAAPNKTILGSIPERDEGIISVNDSTSPLAGLVRTSPPDKLAKICMGARHRGSSRLVFSPPALQQLQPNKCGTVSERAANHSIV